MGKELGKALDECLGLLAQGRGVEECLERYPALAGELEPLLRAAVVGQRALCAPQPSPQARAAGRAWLMASLAGRRKERGRWTFLPRRVALALASLMALVLLSSGVVMASWDSLPGQPLYGIKRATETVRLRLTPSPPGQARFLVQLAERRLEEIQALEVRGDIEGAEGVRHKLKGHLGQMKQLAAGMGREEAQGVALRMAQRRGRVWVGPDGVLFRELPAQPPAPFLPVPATPAPTPVPKEAIWPAGALPTPARPSGPEGLAGKARELATPPPTPTPSPPALLPPPPPSILGLEAAERDFEQALQELLDEIEKKMDQKGGKKPLPRPPRGRR